MKYATTFILGAIAATSFLLACGDDTPATADAAAACDCPAAEPPLDGRVVRRQSESTVLGGERKSRGSTCEEGETLLSGSCNSPSTVGLNLLRSGLNAQQDMETTRTWVCTWENENPLDPAEVVTTVICLTPAAQ